MTSLFAALLNGIVASAALAAVLWIALRLAPRRLLNAATRYAIWCAALATTAVLPALYLTAGARHAQPAAPLAPSELRVSADEAPPATFEFRCG